MSSDYSDTPIDKMVEEVPQEVYVFPASYGQKRMWFLDQFEPGSPYYNIATGFRLTGTIDYKIFRKVVVEIVRRHESLRTTFFERDGEPLQVISPELELSVPFIDLSMIPPAEREKEISRRATEEARSPFDLQHGPLIRITVLKSTPTDHVILLTLHHIISDGWSTGILVNEITTLYAAFSQGLPSPLPELEIQYADFSEWQKEYFQGEIYEKQLSYWKTRFETIPPSLELPTDRTRPSVWTNEGSSFSHVISGQMVARLNQLARDEGTTPFMALLAVFYVLLSRYSGLYDVSVGTPIANRTRREVENIIGLFINTLVFRIQSNPTASFRQLIRHVREITLEAFENQDLPFEILVDALQLDRNMSYSPLFQVMFILQNAPVKMQSVADLTLSMIEVDMGTSTFDLTLSLVEAPDALLASVEYNTDLFDRATVERMVRHYANLISAVVEQPEVPLSSLSMIGEEERTTVVYDWNRTSSEFDRQKCIHQVFEETVERSPDTIAVVFNEQRITYGSLNRRANQLARYLKRFLVENEQLVGICLEKSIDLLVTVLGVLKSGGAYLPLDPSYPSERLHYMLEDSGTQVLISHSSLRNILPEFSDKIILLDEHLPEIAIESYNNLDLNVSSDNLAYVIYTSGSTGKVKGSMISHLSLVNAYLAWEKAYELRTLCNSHLQMASFSFDVFGGDWTRALCSGGKLVLVPREILLQADELYELMEREHVNIAEFVPAVLRNLIQYLEKLEKKLDFFRALIAGSDIWYAGEYKNFLKFCSPQTRLINSFGLTEATIDSSFFEAISLDIEDERLVPIGRPFDNMTLYILNDYLQPLPVGVRGELYVGGIGLARGYLNRSDLTAEKFPPNPFALNGAERMYKTGDIARFLPDGNIEFLGRGDDQIKLRGFRIELGEIETALKRHPQVKETVVAAHEWAPGDKRIFAYFVAEDSAEPKSKELYNFLSKELPDYMIPSAFISLERIPLTPNGKVDRRALPLPGQDDLTDLVEADYVAPRNPLEEMMATLWSEVLQIEKVGVFSNFFELGGHSLLATQLVSRLKKRFQIDIPLRAVFEKSTLAALAQLVGREQRKEAGMEEPEIVPVDRDRELPLSFAQQRLWFLDQLEPDSPFYIMPESYRVVGQLDVEVFEKSLNEIVRRHETLRTSFITRNGTPTQKISNEVKITLPVIDLTTLPEKERDKRALELVAAETRNPIPLSQVPLFRVKLIKLNPEEHIIILNIHHIISDDWSTKVFIQEIAALYSVYLRNEPSPLPDLPIQYADFASWQRNWLQGEVLDKQLNYWKNHLADIPPLLELPTDRPRPAVQTFDGSYKTFSIPLEIASQIRKILKEEGSTLFMGMLAVFKIFLNKYSRQETICVGVPIANRNREEIEGLIGFFVNTLVMKGDLSKDPSFREFLHQINQVSLDAYAHQDIPFEMLVDALQPERNLSHPPLFQVMFTLQNTPMREQALPSGLKIMPVEAHSGTAKFDLTLFMMEDGDALGGALEYNTDLFDVDTIEQMLIHFESLMNAVTENPDKPLSEISLLNPEEQMSIVEEYNRTEPVAYQNTPVHELFEKQVTTNPAATAVVFENQYWSYDSLNRWANRLAHYLIKKGFGPEKKVGICVDRTFEMIYTLMGILKSGAAYVPLDPHLPRERLSFILEDSGVEMIVSLERYREWFSEFPNQEFYLDSGEDELSSQPDRNPAVNLDLKNQAYVLYTSGSTGKPKGTSITHEGFLNYLNWSLNAYPLSEGRGSIVHSTIAFDATITAIFPSLLSGKTLYLLPEESEIDALGKVMEKERGFSLMKITPAHMEVLSHVLVPDSAAAITRSLIIGGENLLAHQIEFWQQYAESTLLFNEYGPTETVVGCVVYEASGWQGKGSVPIGKVIPQMRIYVLDEKLQPVPVGIPGELYISGLGVARGYVNRIELTAEKFLPDPFSRVPGERMYRTGDMVRCLKNSNLEFLGRKDTQVKVHGYRIELGEIESLLKHYAGIKEVVAHVLSTEGGEKRLVAYYVAEDENAPENSELLDYLKRHLPDYMVPSAIMHLKEIPLTVNGKVDHRALPVPERDKMEIESEYVEPDGVIEEKLARIWQEILSLKKVGVKDNFFELGGDSIMSIQIISRTNQIGLSYTVKDIFQHPTIRELSKIKSDSRKIHADQHTITGSVKITPIQLWLLTQDIPNPSHYNQSIFFEVKSPLDPIKLDIVLKKITEQHDVLRLQFFREGDTWESYQQESLTNIPFQYIDLSGQYESAMKDLISEITWETQSSLNIANGPIFRVVYLDLGTTLNHRLLIIANHLVIDAYSWRILLEDVQNAYISLEENRCIEFPLKTTSFQYWADKLHELANSTDVKDSLNYMITRIAGKDPSIPRDKKGTRFLEGGAKTITAVLPPDITENIMREFSRVYQIELFHLILYAMVEAVRDWTKKNYVQIDIEGHGREAVSDEIDLARTVGWFTNIYPLLLQIPEEGDALTKLNYVKEILSEVSQHSLNYNLLKYLSQDENIERKFQELPPSDIVLNFLGRFDQDDESQTIFSDAPEDKGPERDPTAQRSYLIEVNGATSGNQLVFEWTYSPEVHNLETIQTVADKVLEELKKLGEFVVTKTDVAEKEGSDFGWSQKDVDDIFSAIENL